MKLFILSLGLFMGSPDCLECNALKLERLEHCLKVKAKFESVPEIRAADFIGTASCRCEDLGGDCVCLEGECRCTDCPTRQAGPDSEPLQVPGACVCEASPIPSSVVRSTFPVSPSPYGLWVREVPARGRTLHYGRFRVFGGCCR